ncbi:50S ribosomal protein L25 [Roseimaritima ulvae]|uniref:Large ribosomal subunit protein bL25 n=1 Tax=Roseimaritima ulvae TaxID=980254 RepID=A0A5B9QS83_9BACT|nr:50S ribosomal protein L25 [Roseimaritima ulvae]QEG39896.1 50S ribosomal protein L25 [Roseimaritima ulvae]
MAEVLHVEKREQMGSSATARVRRNGRVPAVLYGHGQPNEHLSIARSEVDALIRHHGRAVELQGSVADTAMVNDVQWDALGMEILHLDLLRVNLKEQVEVAVSVRVHGEAPGTREGGVLIENVHEVEIRCPAGSIPEFVGLNVSDLQIDQHAVASALELPDDAELVTDPETVIAHVEVPREQVETEGGEGDSEPELIGKKEDGEDSAAE